MGSGSGGDATAAAATATGAAGGAPMSDLDTQHPTVSVGGVVTVAYRPASGVGSSPHVLVEWKGGRAVDAVADAVVAVLLQVREGDCEVG